MKESTIQEVNKEIPNIILQILESRGIGENEREEFFSPSPKLVHDPFLLTNMMAGVDLLIKAIDSGKRIVIYGDYDVDGITSTALLMKVLGSLTDNVTYYIPSRLDEGYGLHKESINKIHEDGGELIVTVDCGSVSREETGYAHSIGIETIVTDHHNMSDTKAEGIIINPRMPGDKYPFKGLAGVGVAYKLALALARKKHIPQETMSEVLELVAIGTIADIMPLMDENRTIVKFGLMFIRLGCRNKGLRRLIDLSGLDYRTIRANDISYGIAPKINAAGRLGDAGLGVRLFLADDPDEIEFCCNELIKANQDRRKLQEDAYNTGKTLADEELSNGNFLILEINDSHEGVLGIVAGKIREDVNRPVVVISRNGDHYKGTGRSIPTVDLFEMLDKYSEVFKSFGGHRAACGFTISTDKIEKLKADLNKDIDNMYKIKNTIFDIEYFYDVDIDVEDIDLDLARATELLEPCGKGNEVPIFLVRNAQISEWRFLKGENKYAKFRVTSEEGAGFDCLLFRDAQKVYDMIETGEKLDILGNIEVNRWRDSETTQMIVQSILPSGEIQ